MTAASPETPISAATSVEVRRLTVRAGGRTLLENASARFEPDEVTLIVGPSGAGKSLLLRILAGLIGGREGPVRFQGDIRIGGRPHRHAADRVGVVFQNFALFDELSPAANVRLARAHQSSARRDGNLTPEKLLGELRVPRHTPTAALSGGQRQRLAIARTLAYNPEVLLYDEPTSGLDPATAAEVAKLLAGAHESHPKTSIIVTHDYESLAPIADCIYLLDSETRALRRVERDEWPRLRDQLHPAPAEAPPAEPPSWRGWLRERTRRLGDGAAGFFVGTSRVAEAVVAAPLRLLPLWKSPVWGFRFLLHYLRLAAGPSAWVYIAIAGLIVGFVATYFTFRFLPYAAYTEPLLIEDLLQAMGFALYRILAPVLTSVLIAARCGAAVASDVGGKSYGQQMDALRTFGAEPKRYLLTGILYAFLLGTPLLIAIGYFTAAATSLVVFAATHAEYGPAFWRLHFHRELINPEGFFYLGTSWLAAKTLLCAAGIALIAYHQGARPKQSGRDVSRAITSTVLWATLHVLVVHFAFAFFEFEPYVKR